MKAPSFINPKGILFREDCLMVMSEIKADTINCIFADPPFNINKLYTDTRYKDKKSKTEYEEWTRKWLSECVRILKPGGSLFIYHRPQDLIGIGAYLNKNPYVSFRNWVAVNMKNGFPIRRRLHPTHYGLLYYVKNGDEFTFNVVRTQTPKCRHCDKLIKDYGGYRDRFEQWEDEGGTPCIQISDYWDDARPERHYKNRPISINELPYEIAERAILMSTNEGDIVFDPFGGSGSTFYAAQINNRYWIGSEIGDNKYIIHRMMLVTRNMSKIAPAKFKRLFINNSSENLALGEKAHEKLSNKLSRLKEQLKKGSQKKKNVRYSHRMTNRIFD